MATSKITQWVISASVMSVNLLGVATSIHECLTVQAWATYGLKCLALLINMWLIMVVFTGLFSMINAILYYIYFKSPLFYRVHFKSLLWWSVFILNGTLFSFKVCLKYLTSWLWVLLKCLFKILVHFAWNCGKYIGLVRNEIYFKSVSILLYTAHRINLIKYVWYYSLYLVLLSWYS